MSLLNFGLQGCAYARSAGPDRFETQMKSCNSMQEVRSKADQETWAASVAAPIKSCRERISQLMWSDEPVECPLAATTERIAKFNAILQLIEPNVDLEKCTQVEMRTLPKLQAVLDSHVKLSGDYLLEGNSKVEGCDCEACKQGLWAPWSLPFDLVEPMLLPIARATIIEGVDARHYMPYAEAKTKPVTAEHQPSKQARVAADAEDPDKEAKDLGFFKASSQVHRHIKCGACDKPRCVYSLKAFDRNYKNYTPTSVNQLNRVLHDSSYKCGDVLFSNDHPCHEQFFVKASLKCSDPIEAHYYTSPKYARKEPNWSPICCFCAGSAGLVEPSTATKSKYKSWLLLCTSCQKARLEDPKTRENDGFIAWCVKGGGGNKRKAPTST